MKNQKIYFTLRYVFAAVWLINGFYCKLLNGVPRHQQIVARILGETYARPLTVLIGIAEIMMAVWILSKYQSKLNAYLQMIVVATMNTLEFFLVPDLLLWGKLNALFAGLFVICIYWNEFLLRPKISLK